MASERNSLEHLASGSRPVPAAGRPNPFARALGVASVATALLLAALARRLPSPDLHVPALSVIPSGSTLLVVARPGPLQALGLLRLPKSAEPSRLLAEIATTCKINPLDEVDEVALATPGSARDGTFGLVLTGTFPAAPRVACIERLARDHGRSEGLTKRRAGAHQRFQLLALADDERGASVALADGLLLIGSAAYVAEMIRTADASLDGLSAGASGGSAATEAMHQGLRREFGEGALVVASLRLLADTRETIRREVGDPNAPAGQIVGLLGSVRSDGRTSRLQVAGMVACEDEASAKAMADVVERMARDAEGTATARFLGLAPLLHDRSVTTEGRAAVLRTHAAAATLGSLLDAVEKAWAKD